jgi:hypothetical protein
VVPQIQLNSLIPAEKLQGLFAQKSLFGLDEVQQISTRATLLVRAPTAFN